MTPWPKQMRQKFKDVQALTQFCFPDGSEIFCKPCGIERHCTPKEIAGWLENGYPRCKKCGERTSIRNPHIKKVEFE